MVKANAFWGSVLVIGRSPSTHAFSLKLSIERTNVIMVMSNEIVDRKT
jgi:hypothetical protein